MTGTTMIPSADALAEETVSEKPPTSAEITDAKAPATAVVSHPHHTTKKKQTKRDLSDPDVADDALSVLGELLMGIVVLIHDRGRGTATEEQLIVQQKKHQLFAKEWTAGAAQQRKDITNLGDFNIYLARTAPGYLIAQQEKLNDIIDSFLREQHDLREQYESSPSEIRSAAEATSSPAALPAADDAAEATPSPAALPAVDDAAEAQKKLEKRRKGKNFAFREWLFEFFPKYVEKNSQMITEIAYLKSQLTLLPTEEIAFKEALGALYALQAVHESMVEQLHARIPPFDEFSQKSEEEQVEMVKGLFDERLWQVLGEVAFPAFNLPRYLDRIFTLHRDEIEALPQTQKKEFAFLRREVGFQIQARIMQGLTRVHMLASAVQPYLESTQAEFSELCDALGEIPKQVNELDRINALCHNHHAQHNPSDIKIDRDDFLQNEKSKQFLSFLEKDKKKLACFKLLQTLSEKGVDALRESRRKSVPPTKKNQNDIEKVLPFLDKVLNELLEETEREGYELALMSTLPQNGKPKERVVYLAQDGDVLRYVVLNLKNVKVEGFIEIHVEGELSLDSLNMLKNQILEQTSIQGVTIGKEAEEQQKKEKILLAFNAIKSLLLNTLEPDFISFSQPRIQKATVLKRLSGMFEGGLSKRLSGLGVPAEKEASYVEPKLISSEVTTHALDLAERKVTASVKPTDVSTSSKPELKRSQSDTQLGKTQFEPQQEKVQSKSLFKKSDSAGKMSTLFDNAEKAISSKIKSVVESFKNGPFIGKKSDICAPVSFIDYARTAWSVTQTLKKRKEYKTLEFIYKRGEKEIRNKKPKNFRKGDSAEVRDNGELICSIVPQQLPEDAENQASGVGVTVCRHTDPDIRFAVRMMVEALQGKKRIYITIRDRESPEGRELALKYMSVIFSEGAIPVLKNENENDKNLNDEDLDEEETKNELQKMVDAHNASAPSTIAKYRFLSERYEAEVKRIEEAERADKLYLAEFTKFIESSGEESSEFNNILIVVSRFADVAFVNHNLNRDDFIVNLLIYLQKGYPGRDPHNIDKAKKELKVFLDNRLADMSEVLPLEQIVQEAFNLATKRLDINLQISNGKLKVVSRQEQVERDLFFLIYLESWLQNPQPARDKNKKIIMQNPNDRNEELEVEGIAIELTRIALVDNILTEEALISKMLDCIRKGFDVNTVSADRMDEIKHKASHELKDWISAKDSYGVDGISCKLFNFLQQALVNSDVVNILPGLMNVDDTALSVAEKIEQQDQFNLPGKESSLFNVNLNREPEPQQVLQPVVRQEEQLQDEDLSEVTATVPVHEPLLKEQVAEKINLQKDENLPGGQLELATDSGHLIIEEKSNLPEPTVGQVYAEKTHVDIAEKTAPAQNKSEDKNTTTSAILVRPPLPPRSNMMTAKSNNPSLKTDSPAEAKKSFLPGAAAKAEPATAHQDHLAAIRKATLKRVSEDEIQPKESVNPVEKTALSARISAAMAVRQQQEGNNNSENNDEDDLGDWDEVVNAPNPARDVDKNEAVQQSTPAKDLPVVRTQKPDIGEEVVPPKRSVDVPQEIWATEPPKPPKEIRSAIVARREAFDDERDDEDGDTEWEDGVFLEEFNALVKKIAIPSFTLKDVTMIDPNTNQVLNAHAILTRLAEVVINKNISEDEFAHKIIAFGWFLSPQYASGRELSDAKKKSLTDEIMKHIQVDRDSNIHPGTSYIDNIVSKLVEIAQHEMDPHHTSNNSTHTGFFRSCAAALKGARLAVVAPPCPEAINTPKPMKVS